MPLSPELTPAPDASLGAGASADEEDPLLRAWLAARADLMAEQTPEGHWVGELASSPLSTATAISALAIAERYAASQQCMATDERTVEAAERWNAAYQTDLSELICTSVRWLAAQQNDDGGWGDTDRSRSNLATTLLVLSAFRMTGVPAKFPELEPRAEQYLRTQGGPAGLRKRYGVDKTFAAPILANCALAGIVPWRQVPTLPFELAAMPRSWFRRMGLPVVSYALPALVGIGLAKHHHRPSANPVTRSIRRLAIERCLRLVTGMQPDSGGFLEATPLTSFVVMGLASTGRADHKIVRHGVEFLLASVRPDGSWPIDTNLATWNTTLAINALRKGHLPAAGNSTALDRVESNAPAGPAGPAPPLPRASAALDWLLACQHLERHPFTDADPGGWGWTNLSGGVPDADDTAGALLALQGYWQSPPAGSRTRIARSVSNGVRWLLGLQNRDGGWPTFCRGWGKLPFDRSATDLTAHVLRALDAWRRTRGWWTADSHAGSGDPIEASRLAAANLDDRIDRAIEQGLAYLARQQRDDGSWAPLWFGNETRPGEENPVFGTSRVLTALAALGEQDSPMGARGLQWLVGQQHAGGGWGASPTPRSPANTPPQGDNEDSGENHQRCSQPPCSVEETAVAVDALLACDSSKRAVADSVQRGARWLIDAVQQGRTAEPAPIGLYFAKLWYYERLYPKSFIVSALGSAIERQAIERPPRVRVSVVS